MFLFRRSTNSRIQRLRASALVDFRAAAAVAFTGPTPSADTPSFTSVNPNSPNKPRVSLTNAVRDFTSRDTASQIASASCLPLFTYSFTNCGAITLTS